MGRKYYTCLIVINFICITISAAVELTGHNNVGSRLAIVFCSVGLCLSIAGLRCAALTGQPEKRGVKQ